MANLKLSGKHIMLLLLYVPGKTQSFGEAIDGRTRIVKMMFLFDQEIKKDFLKNTDIEIIKFPEFYPWNFGPFSKEVYDDIEFFVNNDYIKIEFLINDKRWFELEEFQDWEREYLLEDIGSIKEGTQCEERFSLTKRGTEHVINKIWTGLTDNQRAILGAFKKRINSGTIEAILRYTYLKYPAFTTKSKIKERIFGLF